MEQLHEVAFTAMRSMRALLHCYGWPIPDARVQGWLAAVSETAAHCKGQYSEGQYSVTDAAFLMACAKGHLDVVTAAQHLAPPVQRVMQHGYYLACMMGVPGVVEFLLRVSGPRAVNVHGYNEAGLRLACAGDHGGVVHVLLQESGALAARVEAACCHALHLACVTQGHNALSLLQSSPAWDTVNAHQLLQDACAAGNAGSVRVVLEKRAAALRSTPEKLWACVPTACRHRSASVMKALLPGLSDAAAHQGGAQCAMVAAVQQYCQEKPLQAFVSVMGWTAPELFDDAFLKQACEDKALGVVAALLEAQGVWLPREHFGMRHMATLSMTMRFSDTLDSVPQQELQCMRLSLCTCKVSTEWITAAWSMCIQQEYPFADLLMRAPLSRCPTYSTQASDMFQMQLLRRKWTSTLSAWRCSPVRDMPVKVLPVVRVRMLHAARMERLKGTRWLLIARYCCWYRGGPRSPLTPAVQSKHAPTGHPSTAVRPCQSKCFRTGIQRRGVVGVVRSAAAGVRRHGLPKGMS